MPVYEFRCTKCQKVFEVTASISKFDPARVKCPKCKSAKVDRHYSSVFAITSKKS